MMINNQMQPQMLTIVTKLNTKNPIDHDGKHYLAIESNCYENHIKYSDDGPIRQSHLISTNTKRVDDIFSDGEICLTNLLDKIYSEHKQFIDQESHDSRNPNLEPGKWYYNGTTTKNFGLLSSDNRYIITGRFNGSTFIPAETNIYLENNTPIIIKSNEPETIDKKIESNMALVKITFGLLGFSIFMNMISGLFGRRSS